MSPGLSDILTELRAYMRRTGTFETQLREDLATGCPVRCCMGDITEEIDDAETFGVRCTRGHRMAEIAGAVRAVQLAEIARADAEIELCVAGAGRAAA